MERVRAEPRSQPGNPAPPAYLPGGELPWRVLGLLAIYRLLVPPLLLMVQHPARSWALVPADPRLYSAACLAYFTLGLALLAAQQRRWLGPRRLALVYACVDSAGLALLLY